MLLSFCNHNYFYFYNNISPKLYVPVASVMHKKEIQKRRKSWAMAHGLYALAHACRSVASPLHGFFSFLYLKKIKISKIYGGFEKFQNYTPVSPYLGDGGLSPSGWAIGPKCKKKLYLGLGARDALNSELVK